MEGWQDSERGSDRGARCIVPLQYWGGAEAEDQEGAGEEEDG
jgi:hypothetical protein